MFYYKNDKGGVKKIGMTRNQIAMKYRKCHKCELRSKEQKLQHINGTEKHFFGKLYCRKCSKSVLVLCIVTDKNFIISSVFIFNFYAACFAAE